MTMPAHRLDEYSSRMIEAPPPSAADRQLADRLAAGGDLTPRLDVRWLDQGRMEVTTFSWVGVVRFSAVEIHVVPKLVGGALRVLRMIEYARGVPLLAQLPRDRQLPGDGDDLFDLVVLLLVEEVKALIRDGLIRDYRPVEETLDRMRGRLRMREQYLRRFGQLHQIECAYDEFDGDIPENQLLAVALKAAVSRVRDIDVRKNARVFADVLDEVCAARSRESDWYQRRIQYGRRNARYRPAHELAKLVLDGLALDDRLDGSVADATSFMVNMNAIFERFITRLAIDALAGTELRAQPQRTMRTVIVDEVSGQTYSTIRPDLVIDDPTNGRTVPIDVKYKLYDTTKFSSTDIYQSFVYAYAVDAGTATPRAGLIYPSVTAVDGPALYVKPSAGANPARIRGAGLDVVSILEHLGNEEHSVVHEQMRAVIRTITGLHTPALTAGSTASN